MQILPEMTSLSFVHPTTALPCMKYYSNIYYLTWVELADVLNWTSLAKFKTEVGFQLGLLLGFATLNDQCSNRNPQQTCRKMLTVTLKNDKGKQLITRQLTNSKKTTWSAAVGGRKGPKVQPQEVVRPPLLTDLQLVSHLSNNRFFFFVQILFAMSLSLVMSVSVVCSLWLVQSDQKIIGPRMEH